MGTFDRFLRRAHTKDLNVCPGDQGYTLDAFVRTLAAAFVSEILIYTSVTISPDEAWKGVFLVSSFFVFSILASYGMLRKCEARSGFLESGISFTLAFVIAIVFGWVLSSHDPADIISVEYFLTSDMLVAWAVGGFFGSFLSSVK